jgi:Carboxypeptidase regulatory-like domain
MRNSTRVLTMFLLALATAGSAWAQLRTGNVYGAVADESGAVLPGATVTLTGGGIGARSTVSGSQGAFRFLNLEPGRYKLTIALPGFTTVNREVGVPERRTSRMSCFPGAT